MDWMLVAEGVAMAVGVTAGIYLGVKEWRERKVRKRAGLESNPTRCTRHEERITAVEKSCVEFSTLLRALEGDIQEVKSGVNRLIDIHLKP